MIKAICLSAATALATVRYLLRCKKEAQDSFTDISLNQN